MKHTFNGCSRSNFTVSPANWKTGKASIAKPWRIFYRFYDPSFKEHAIKGKITCVLRGMNSAKDLAGRQGLTRQLLADVTEQIDVKGYNPITAAYMSITPEEIPGDTEIRSSTPLLEALALALLLVDATEETKTDIRSVLKYFGQSAKKLGKDKIPVKEVRRGDLIIILNNCKNLTVKYEKNGEIQLRKKIWTANQFNHYRKYLSILYGQLDLMEVIDYNPIEKIPLKEEPGDLEKAPRRILTPEEAEKVDTYLRGKDPAYHRWIHIFFHSGARRNELMRVQGKQVDLPGQRFRVLVKKRRKKVWVWKTIKDIALPFWEQVMQRCGQEDYVWSIGFEPGPRAIRPEQATRRWRRHCKNILGIVADMYSLKHKNTTEQIEALLESQVSQEEATRAAAEHNSHTSEAMVIGIYDVRNKKRKHLEVKAVANSFTGKAK